VYIRHTLDRKIHEDALAKFIEIDREAIIWWYPLHTAIRFGNIAAVKVALEAGIPPNGPSYTDPRGAITSYWGPYGEWVEVARPMDRLPLMETIDPKWIQNPNSEENIQKRLMMARLLLEHGADVNELGSKYQKSCLQTAKEKSLPEFVSLLEEFATPS
jgi:ankyrin repeat protein